MIFRATLLAAALWATSGLAQTATPTLPVTLAVAPATPQNTYTVERGDTLFHISQLFGTTVEDLMAANSLDSVTVDVGQVLRVPGAPGQKKSGPKPAAQAPVQGPSTWKLTPPPVTSSGPAARGQPVLRAASTAASALPQAYLGGLSFSMQTYNNCGPAAVSGVLGYYGLRLDQESLRRSLRPAGGYMSAEVIDPYVRQFGLRAPVFKNGNLAAIKRLVAQGIPVIVLQWLDRPGHIPHFRIVRGYDDQTGLVWVSDSMIGEAAYVSYQNFDALWNTQGRLMIPVYPAAFEGQVLQLVGLGGIQTKG